MKPITSGQTPGTAGVFLWQARPKRRSSTPDAHPDDDWPRPASRQGLETIQERTAPWPLQVRSPLATGPP